MLVNRELYRIDQRAPERASLFLDFENGYGRVNGKPVNALDMLTTVRNSTRIGLNAEGAVSDIAIDQPRIWRERGRSGLLIERSIENAVLFSANPSVTEWAKANGAQGFFNNTDGIDGKITAGHCIDVATAGTPAGTWSQTVGIDGAANWWTCSVYVRQRTGSKLRFYMGITNGVSSVGGDTVFDTDLGAVVSSGVGVVSRAEPAPLGYVRLIVSVNNTVGAGALVMLLARENDAASPVTFDFDRAQINRGKSPGTPIRTTTAKVTAQADVISIDVSAADWFNQSLGSIVIDATITGSEDGDQNLFTIVGGGTSNWIDIYRDYNAGAASIGGRGVISGALTSFGGAAGALKVPRRIRAAMTYTPFQSWRLAVAGTEADWTDAPYGAGVITMTGTNAVPANKTAIQLGHIHGTSFLDGIIHRLAYFPNVLTAAELSALVM